jgi:[ribosomal protein S18]-alanine N-acetyltransferase
VKFSVTGRPAEIRLREAQPQDLDAVVALERATDSAPRWSSAAYTAIMQQDNVAMGRCLIIAERSEADSAVTAFSLVGFAVAAMQDGTAELESVAVAAAVRRAGIGRMLCEAVITRSKDHGASEMTLEVRAASAGAIALYSGLGFTEAARRAGYYQQPADDAVVMRLPLA